ncbi:MAG: family 78 glycoside hydrolase catalytic domain [Eubacteriales bacterium]|nr:family 78 glycoside hydrolase catalytic domain [Eubacteriales bacterium]
MKITKLRTNHMENPIGYALEGPVLTWTVEEARGTRTQSAQVQIAADPDFTRILSDSGVRTDLDSRGYVPELTLRERTRYYWRVSVQDDTGESGISGTAFFETAPEKIAGQWITAPFGKDAHAIYQKSWTLPETSSAAGRSVGQGDVSADGCSAGQDDSSAADIVSARLYISGLGVYEAYLNGEKIGDEYLAPFYNDYNNWIQLQTYDVTELLRGGMNTLGVMLGNGWYKGRFGFIDKMDRIYGDTQAFVCELELVCADGTRRSIVSDESFLCHTSAVLESSIYDGEVYDARLEQPGFGLPAAGSDLVRAVQSGAGSAAADGTDDAATAPESQARGTGGRENLTEAAASDEALRAQGWVSAVPAGEEIQAFSGRLRARRSLPLTVQESLKPVEVIHTPAGETVLDFGQNLTGLFTFVCREPEGAEIRLQFGEILQSGNFYNDNLRSAKEAYRYISDGTARIVRPHFTFYGFRYMKVEGIGEVNPEDFTALVLHSEMERTGWIETSNEKVNQLFHNALWGQKGNFVDVPTDCPQRDERMGWTGDAQVFCATASFNMYTPAFYRKYLYDMLGEQRELGGSVPHVVPDILDQINAALRQPGRAQELGMTPPPADADAAAGSCAWGDAATVIPWTTYLFYGDRTMLAAEYENMKLWTDHIRRIDEEKCGGRRLWTHGFHFADWLALDNFHKDTCFGGTDPYYVASTYYLYSAQLTAQAAAALGREEEAAQYGQLAEEVREAMRGEYFTPTGRLAVDTQTAMVLALYFDIAPQEARGRLIEALRAKLEEENVHLTTGFVGTPYLCPALTENGLAQYAYTLLLNEDFPSWLYEVNMGATTVWERWNSVLPDGMISDTGMNSLNHYAYGSIVEWMYRYMCGLNPDKDEPGFRRFTIRPYPDARFGQVEMRYESVYGTIRSGWKQEDGAWVFTVRVPFDTQARFELPEAVLEEAKVCVRRADGTVLESAGESLLRDGGTDLVPGEYVITVARALADGGEACV